MTAREGELTVELRDLAREILAVECATDRLRCELDDEAPTRARWDHLAAAGFTGAAVAEPFGGLGLSEVDLVLLLEEVGYAALPEPLAETLCVVTPILQRYGSSQLKERWLPGIASGDVIATVQLAGVPAAAFGQLADVALLGAADGLHFIELKCADCQPMSTLDAARRPARIQAGTNAGSRLDGGGVAVAEALARGTAAAAAVLNGVTRRLLDMAVKHAITREQFGVPVGSFQAVKHLLADVSADLETARPAAWFAAQSIVDDEPDSSLAASVAKLAANVAARRGSQNAFQVHGGIGFTAEHDLHIWLKRSKALELQWGSARQHRRILGAAAMSCDALLEAFGPKLDSDLAQGAKA